MSLDIDSITDESPLVTEDEQSAVRSSADSDDQKAGADSGAVADEPDHADETQPTAARGHGWKRILAFTVLPGVALIVALGVGYLKWQDNSAELARQSAVQSVQVATESTVAMLAYQPDTVDKDLPAAAERLTGSFRDDYRKLINDIVIPGSKEKRIAAVATVPAAASVSATENRAVVLVFVNQTTIIGDGAPTNSISSVRVTLDKVQDRWLVSAFDPV